MAIFFGKIAQMKYRINTKVNPCDKAIFSCLKDYKTNLYDFLYATLLYKTPGWDLIQSNNNHKIQKAVKRKINILNESLS